MTKSASGPKQTPLERIIVAQIEEHGPMPLERYFDMCLSHEQFGYYRTRNPLGRAGDFITAPEVSQVFGELIGIWCAAGWQTMNAPDPFHLIELGPGRGTLMADLMRAGDVMPGFCDSVQVHMVETSAVLKQEQERTLRNLNVPVSWHAHLDDIPEGPCLIVANEFFDALPVRQIVRGPGGWYDRAVVLDDGRLVLGAMPEVVADEDVPVWVGEAQDGEIAETSRSRSGYAQKIARRVSQHGGAALIIDYGHVRSATGDTVQAIRKHSPADILEMPGECDLTSHVDFEALEMAARAEGAKVHGPMAQGQFLLRMGLAERIEVLKKRGDARQRIMLSRAAERLAAGAQMGHLFKVLAIAHPELATPAPFGAPEGNRQ